MKNETDILRDLSGKFAQADIAYMLTGSFAMNYYAQPRMTRDLDVVVQLTAQDAERIVRLFSAEYYVAIEAVNLAITNESAFNLIHLESVIKVDCIVRKKSAFRQLEFERRRQIKIQDFTTWIASKEDLIISKLYWARDSRSETQLRDVKNLLGTEYDTVYLVEVGERIGLRIAAAGMFGMNDTPLEVERLVREMMMARSGEARLLMGSSMFDAARDMVIASLPENLPTLEFKRRLFERLYGFPLEQALETKYSADDSQAQTSRT